VRDANVKARLSITRSQSVTVFATLTVLLSFGAYLLPAPREAVPFLMVCLPATLAWLLVAATEGQAGLRALWAGLSLRRIRLKWLIVALALGVGLRLAISLAALALGLIPRLQWRDGPPELFGLLAVIFVFAATMEEVGWRGFVLPRLLQRHSGLAAGLLLGVPWGVLHLALHLPGMEGFGMPPLVTVLQLTGLSVVLTWLYLRGGQSLMLVTLLHATWNFFTAVNAGIPLLQLNWLMAGVLGLAALTLAVWPGSGLRRMLHAQPPAGHSSKAVEASRQRAPLA
jgi:membrane protease YdiL (CAAX protease family)